MANGLERFVIVCLFSDEVLDFHENITGEVCNLFNVRRQKLPAHFTIKAPFEHNNIVELEEITENFCKNHCTNSLTLNNYGSFRNSVVYMNVKLSEDAKNTHDSYIDELKKVKWLDWRNNEGKKRIFHCTIVSKLKPDKFNDVWEYVIKHPCSFDAYFDNISILKWQDNRWVTYKKYLLMKK